MSDMLAIFAGQLVPPQYDRVEVSTRKGVVASALESSSLNVHHLFESGSWTHGTGIKQKSDVDYMAWCISQRPQLPSSALRTAKAAVEGCDWKISGVSVSSPVIAVKYLTPPNFEIAPAWFKEEVRGFRVFWIAGRGDEWVLSAPDAHLAYVDVQNKRLNNKVKPLVRLLKAWKNHDTAPVSSFYLEMRTAEYAATQSSIIYAIDLRAVFRKMIGEEVRDMNDPEHIVGRIPATSSDENRRTVLPKMREALSHLESAESAEKAEDRTAYWIHMRMVFGNDFPWPDW
jgi:hypothetical protein